MTRLMNRETAAEWLCISEDQVAELAHRGELRYINVGRGQKRARMRFTEEDLEEFVARRRRREVCLSTSPKSHRITISTSRSEVIGFTAVRAAQLAGKPKPTKP